MKAQTQQDMLNALPLAKKFCASPDFKKLTCGLASDGEQSATLGSMCLRCGTLYRLAPDKYPAEVQGHISYYQQAIQPISLACKDPVLVRTVFKVTEAPTYYPDKNCTAFALESSPSNNQAVRCELELPATGGTEAERALKGKEGKCWACGLCGKGKGCPSEVDKWYSDAYTTVARGCTFNETVGYEPQTVYWYINPHTTVLLAKFEVCNSPGCFDPAYEAAKKASARSCDNGKCV